MSKISRRIREINNKNRALYGEEALPSPDGGYAPEQRPNGWEDVERWFRSATSEQPHRRRAPIVPSDQDINRIARLINELQEYQTRPIDESSKVAIEKRRRLQRATDELKIALDDVLALVESPTDDPAILPLENLKKALCLAVPVIGPRPKQGHQLEAWQAIARNLEGIVKSTLRSAGHQGGSLKPDGPLIKIICMALEKIDGHGHDPEAVASWLKRDSVKGGKKM
jgi:hypothetical protein